MIEGPLKRGDMVTNGKDKTTTVQKVFYKGGEQWFIADPYLWKEEHHICAHCKEYYRSSDFYKLENK